MGTETTLLEALARCHGFKSKSRQLLFEIRFDDSERTIMFGKNWNKVLKKFVYFHRETCGPCIGSDEDNFVGNLACCKGVGFGGNIPNYKVICLDDGKKKN